MLLRGGRRGLDMALAMTEEEVGEGVREPDFMSGDPMETLSNNSLGASIIARPLSRWTERVVSDKSKVLSCSCGTNG